MENRPVTPDPDKPEPLSGVDPHTIDPALGPDPYPYLNGQGRATREAMERAGLRLGNVWLRYFSFSGEAAQFEVGAYLDGVHNLSAVQADLLSHAVNDLIDKTPGPRAPYSHQEHHDR